MRAGVCLVFLAGCGAGEVPGMDLGVPDLGAGIGDLAMRDLAAQDFFGVGADWGGVMVDLAGADLGCGQALPPLLMLSVCEGFACELDPQIGTF